MGDISSDQPDYLAPKAASKKDLEAATRDARAAYRAQLKQTTQGDEAKASNAELKNFEVVKSELITQLTDMDNTSAARVVQDLELTATFDDTYMAIRFWVAYGHLYVLIMPDNQWHYLSEGVYKPDENNHLTKHLRSACQLAIAESPAMKDATRARLNRAETWERIKSVLHTLPDMQRNLKSVNTREDCYGDAEGVRNLRTGEVFQANKDQYLVTMSMAAAPQDPELATPEERAIFKLWLEYISHICCQDTELIEAVRWWLCYSLTGYTAPEKFFYLQGLAGTGKSALVKVLAYVMGDYATFAKSEQFLQGIVLHSTYDYQLKGKRVVVLDEFEVNNAHHQVNTQKIFDYVSGAEVAGGRMRQDPIRYRSVAKLWFTSNERPNFANESDQLRRRLVCWPFHHVEPKPVPQDKFKQIPGLIIHWILQASDKVFAFIDSGGMDNFPMPGGVKEVSDSWSDTQDEFKAFLDCEYSKLPTDQDELGIQLSADIKKQYDLWNEDSEATPLDVSTIGTKLQSRGYKRRVVWIHSASCLPGAKCHKVNCKQKTAYLELYANRRQQQYTSNGKALWPKSQPN